MTTGLVCILYGACAAYVGYLIGLDIQYNRDRTKRDSIFTYAEPRGRDK